MTVTMKPLRDLKVSLTVQEVPIVYRYLHEGGFAEFSHSDSDCSTGIRALVGDRKDIRHFI